MTPHHVKERIVRTVRGVMSRHYPGVFANSGNCLYVAACTVEAIKASGLRAVIQAGTCYWPRLTPEAKWEVIQQDPNEVNVFGYEWEPATLATLVKMARNELPEMHCWAAIPDRNEIVDLTSGQFPEQCRRLIGKDWPGVRPPDWLWQEGRRRVAGRRGVPSGNGCHDAGGRVSQEDHECLT